MKYTVPLSKWHDDLDDYEIRAYKTDTPGVLAHHDLGVRTGPIVPTKEWTVTHAASRLGISPGTFKRLKDAREYAKRIKDLTDWEQDRSDILITDEVKALQYLLSYIYADIVHG